MEEGCWKVYLMTDLGRKIRDFFLSDFHDYTTGSPDSYDIVPRQ